MDNSCEVFMESDPWMKSRLYLFFVNEVLRRFCCLVVQEDDARHSTAIRRNFLLACLSSCSPRWVSSRISWPFSVKLRAMASEWKRQSPSPGTWRTTTGVDNSEKLLLSLLLSTGVVSISAGIRRNSCLR